MIPEFPENSENNREFFRVLDLFFPIFSRIRQINYHKVVKPSSLFAVASFDAKANSGGGWRDRILHGLFHGG
jgi:hypothetical protein